MAGSYGDEFLPGDVVSVNVPNEGQREGLVIGTTTDSVGRQVVEIQFDPARPYYRAWYPAVRRVRRAVGYNYYPQYVHKAPVIGRQVYEF
ncbi:hypothetical protein FRB94_003338 [Tulasnella sp. JGI-2019a]|nr:hypothetical protein FRB93_013358 [Tulasnella sp. JGI-2019a]KAG9003177.1 hypothetical protein FRB94_003338 [Tulasnella sp. JGI-2019a]KAG9027476.1 hypothetical protein FRB95_007746 [Tulasnella sp. JGI-2019a]